MFDSSPAALGALQIRRRVRLHEIDGAHHGKYVCRARCIVPLLEKQRGQEESSLENGGGDERIHGDGQT